MSILTWNGELPLPRVGEDFEFRGGTYYWFPCNCKPECQRPKAYNADGTKNHPMGARLRRFDQGMLLENLLAKYFGIHEFADKLEERDDPLQAWDEFLYQVEPDGKLDLALLITKDISAEEFKAAKTEVDDIMEMLQGPKVTVLPAMDTETFFRMILGDDFLDGDPGKNINLN